LKSEPPPQNVSSVEPYRELVKKLRKDGVEIAAIRERLRERGYTGSYSSVHSFVRNLEPSTVEVTVRVETRPAEEAQVDFGYAGRMIHPDTEQATKTSVALTQLLGIAYTTAPAVTMEDFNKLMAEV